ncbi:ATP-dependent zinc metalloprotease FTSH, chloroplastic-like [Raphidocelis subcapitata]|uniref:ATP-dependent zinc metalloprotease FTSH, chloroplastic-like n=1 Tax=Raphidocelis subcapitata TaxID=307507 RepID=A0A2V0NVS8_9CHLO|nr:ATP-dependent zinc metalloprotease FTSH, chloroplastic-like [Raphidocelis subcapitata]|eukprot:GBF89670.1 ATP-dependent zinc metalloprotease FTSH, chloroplastic-like [Raphidocelis subcapitata]
MGSCGGPVAAAPSPLRRAPLDAHRPRARVAGAVPAAGAAATAWLQPRLQRRGRPCGAAGKDPASGADGGGGRASAGPAPETTTTADGGGGGGDDANAQRAASGAAASTSGSGGPGGGRRQRGGGPGRQPSWLQRALGAATGGGQPWRLLLNVMALFFLIRLWPVGGKGLGARPDSITLQVPFSEFVRRVRANDVASVSVDGLDINFALKPGSSLLRDPPAGAEATRVSFSTVRPPDYSLPYSVLESNGVSFGAVDKRGNWMLSLLVYGLYAVLFLSALNRLPIKLPAKGTGRKHRGGGGARGGGEGARRGGGGGGAVLFADVAGVDEAKEELQEIVEYLRSPEKFSRLGARPPSGVLLVGPPGTGKTLLARAVAGEADVPFFSIAASEFVELYVGMGAMRVRELFANARKEAPAIVFIDEIDAVAKGRDTRLRSVGNDEREQTLNQLLTELDGFETDRDNIVICIAATNRPDVLDAALLRPGRFDRRVPVERPDRVGREQILRVHLQRRGLPLAPDVTPAGLAGATTGFTGADLANLVNEAALLAGRRNKSVVGAEEFDVAVLRAVAGIEKKRSILAGMEKEVVARHEVGHALVGTAVARLLPGSPEVEKLSIIPRTGGALGFTYSPPRAEDRALLFDSEIRGQLAMLMGGRAAELLTCPSVSTGAVDDIRRATDLAYRAVCEYGLSPAVGPLNVSVLSAGGGGDDAGWLSVRDGGGTGRVVEAEVKALLEGALSAAAAVVEANAALHAELAARLAATERLDGPGLAAGLARVGAPGELERFVLFGEVPPAERLAALREAQQRGAGGAAAVAAALPAASAAAALPAAASALPAASAAAALPAAASASAAALQAGAGPAAELRVASGEAGGSGSGLVN